jgi:hypothetical protein
MFRLFPLSFGLSSLFVVSALAAPANLPPELLVIRQQVIDISKANTLRRDNIPAIRTKLEPLVVQLADWFNANRPPNEVALTQQPWKSLWFDDPTIDEFSDLTFGGIKFRIERDKIYQVIEDGFYFNISEYTIFVRNIPIKFQNYLKGAYSLINPPTPENAGDGFLNVVNLRFVYNGLRSGGLPNNVNLRGLTALANTGLLRLRQVPGPIGVTGKLWNLYIDEELRISAGYEDDKPDVIDLYILMRMARTGPTPP